MNAPEVALRKLLGQVEGRAPWRRPAVWAGVAVVLVLGAALWAWLSPSAQDQQPRYTTEAAHRGNLVVKVTASGTLQPTNKAQIGSELSGTVARVHVDVNDRVRKGQVLAELDTSRLQDQVARSRASLDVARANVQQAQATVREATGNLQRLQEVARLSGGKVPSQAELAAAEAVLARARSAVTGSEAGVVDARAALSGDETNLRKAAIRSPMDGVVLARAVDPGNAVAASLQAVTLFTLAEDLTRMKLEVNVDEADVGLVREGQKASFTVSAYPNRAYPAVIRRVSYGSTTKDNVVTYVAELQVDNQDLSLRPGMSATASILATERNDVLLVPNAALRFTPAASAAPAAAASGSGIVSKLMPRPPRGGERRQAGTSTAAARQVWVLENGSATAVPVLPGVSDGRMTEVESSVLKAGMAVITGQAARSGS
ncbi:efflux RND transporter periplasmic adaptor subunit [Ramlibacter sp. AN1133]|uniref:efflux RND transporter periplasmic adaptor subunit n=1 Tax=Ramlibacter sp. AN1133 TaxID=3133429 RepID=UPI0030BDB415